MTSTREEEAEKHSVWTSGDERTMALQRDCENNFTLSLKVTWVNQFLFSLIIVLPGSLSLSRDSQYTLLLRKAFYNSQTDLDAQLLFLVFCGLPPFYFIHKMDSSHWGSLSFLPMALCFHPNLIIFTSTVTPLEEALCANSFHLFIPIQSFCTWTPPLMPAVSSCLHQHTYERLLISNSSLLLYEQWHS